MRSSSSYTVLNRINKAKILVLPLILMAVLWACSSEDEDKDEQFCTCMKVGDELNKFSAELLERQPTEEDAKKMKELKARSKKECSDYYTMSGAEMMKRKKACK